MQPVNCKPGEPFIKLENNGQASILNYQLPQESTYPAAGYVSLNVPFSLFKQQEVSQTNSPAWVAIEEVRKLDSKGIQQAVLNKNNLIIGFPILEKNLRLEAVRVGTLSNNTLLQLVKDKTTIKKLSLDQVKIPIETRLGAQTEPRLMQIEQVNTTPLIVNLKKEDIVAEVKNYTLNTDLIAQQISRGNMPICSTRLSKQNEIRYIQKPQKSEPEISLVLHYKMSSFLGDYGAGQTIKTINLLPGESVMATIRSFRHNESVKSQSQNVLDSFSEYSADELQNTVESITGRSSGSSSGSSSNYGSDWNAGGEASLNLGFFSIGGGGGGGGSKSMASSFNSAMQQQVSNLVSAVDTHVAGSNSERNISINSETITSSITENEELISRNYNNPNLSCTANFVFRQLIQEYITITYLEDISIQYYNGFPESRKVVKLSEIDLLLNEVLANETAINSVRNQIYRAICNIKDYQQNNANFIELVSEQLRNCIDTKDPGEEIKYVRKKIGFSQSAEGYTVPGIIMDVKKRTLRTDSVVADSLLGQGQALDCYNQHLQFQSVKSAELNNASIQLSNDLILNQKDLENRQLSQAIGIIDKIENPLEQAKLYKKIFSECCDVPQVGCGCGEHDGTASPK